MDLGFVDVVIRILKRYVWIRYDTMGFDYMKFEMANEILIVRVASKL